MASMRLPHIFALPAENGGSKNSPSLFLLKSQGLPVPIWSIRERKFEFVTTPIFVTPLSTRFESGKSIKRKREQKGTEPIVLIAVSVSSASS